MLSKRYELKWKREENLPSPVFKMAGGRVFQRDLSRDETSHCGGYNYQMIMRLDSSH